MQKDQPPGISTVAPGLSSRFEWALVYAQRAHANQTRKGSPTPYIAHVLAVTSLVLENGGSETEAIAALLHDVIEDAGGEERRNEIREQFGDAVLHIVEACTDTDQTPKPPFRARKEAHLERMKTCDASTRLVVLADKLHNVSSLLDDFMRHADVLWNRFSGGRDGTLWYYRSAVEALDRCDAHPLWLQFREKVQRLSEAAAVDYEATR